MKKYETKETKNLGNKVIVLRYNEENPLLEFIEAGLQEGLSYKGELGELFEKAVDFCVDKRII
tara:strand:+ start:3336 stop:3524 length:189 start_codon:yes stop_codon:yes gene_type:complete